MFMQLHKPKEHDGSAETDFIRKNIQIFREALLYLLLSLCTYTWEHCVCILVSQGETGESGDKQ